MRFAGRKRKRVGGMGLVSLGVVIILWLFEEEVGSKFLVLVASKVRLNHGITGETKATQLL